MTINFRSTIIGRLSRHRALARRIIARHALLRPHPQAGLPPAWAPVEPTWSPAEQPPALAWAEPPTWAPAEPPVARDAWPPPGSTDDRRPVADDRPQGRRDDRRPVADDRPQAWPVAQLAQAGPTRALTPEPALPAPGSPAPASAPPRAAPPQSAPGVSAPGSPAPASAPPRAARPPRTPDEMRAALLDLRARRAAGEEPPPRAPELPAPPLPTARPRQPLGSRVVHMPGFNSGPVVGQGAGGDGRAASSGGAARGEMSGAN